MRIQTAAATHPQHDSPARGSRRSAQGLEAVDWLDRSEDSQWNAFVAGHPFGTVCQTTRWRDALETAFPHIHGRVLAIRDSRGEICAGTAVYLVQSRLLGDRLVSAPFAARMDPLVSNADEIASILRFLETHRVQIGARSLQIRLSRVPPPEESAEVAVNWILKRHYLPLEEGTEPLWSGFNSSLRWRIRKAGREGVVVRSARTPEDLDVLFSLHGRSRRRLRMPVLPRRFFAELFQSLHADEWDVLIAERDGAALGALSTFAFNGVYQTEWTGDTPEGRRLGVNQRLFWTAMEWAAARGCHTFCFGRTDVSNDGLLNYKRTWGCREEDMPIVMTGARPGSVQRRADTGIARRTAQQILERAPWPVYLRFSEFCYRHLG